MMWFGGGDRCESKCLAESLGRKCHAVRGLLVYARSGRCIWMVLSRGGVKGEVYMKECVFGVKMQCQSGRQRAWSKRVTDSRGE